MSATDNTMRAEAKCCNRCWQPKPDTEEFFHKNHKKPGTFRVICKVCTSDAQKKRSATPESAAMRLASIQRNRENARKSANEWVKRNRQTVSEKQRIRRANNKKQTLAQRAVTSALRNGTLVRQPCFVCGESRVEAHHADYDNKLGVSWLCLAHHGELHAEFSRPDHPMRLVKKSLSLLSEPTESKP